MGGYFGYVVAVVITLGFANPGFSQDFAAVEAGGYSQATGDALTKRFAERVVLRRVGQGLNDDFAFEPGGKLQISGYTRSFEETAVWTLEGDRICIARPNARPPQDRFCRRLFVSSDNWRMAREDGSLAWQGIFRR